jgi:ABC-type lipoprotein release transport system permease subunit
MRAGVLLKLSARSVGRNARRSTLTASAMALGLALLIFSRSLAEGGHEQWIDSAVRLGTGHVAVQAPDYLETANLDHRLDADRVSSVVAALSAPALRDEIESWAPRLSVTGLASSASSALPVRVEGVDPMVEARFSDLGSRIVDGRDLEPGDRLQAVIGVDLASRLDLGVGKRFVVTAQGADGQIEGQLLRVAGIFRTAVPEMDQGLIHLPMETARSWLGAPGAATTLAILLRTSRRTDAVLADLRSVLADDSGIRVLGWRDASPELDSAVRIDDYGDYVFHSILFAIVALAILNAGMMSVLGRRREFGILQAMGLTGSETGLIVFGEGLFLTAASGVVGMIAGLSVTWLLWRDGLDFSGLLETDMTVGGGFVDPVIVPVFHFDQILLSIGFIAVVGTLSSIYPAIRASKLDVADAMKFEQ